MDDAFNLAAIDNNAITPGESLSKNTLTALRKRLKATEVIARLSDPDPSHFCKGVEEQQLRAADESI
jgi:hypothetical protein